MTKKASKYTAPFQVILMFAIILATILLGFFMMPSSQEERERLLSGLGTTNQGTLLSPVAQLSELALTDSKGQPWQLSEQKAKWRLLIPGAANCKNDCDGLLYVSRQMHIRLGKYSQRFERIYISSTAELNADFTAMVATDHPYLKFVFAKPEAVNIWLEGTNSQLSKGKMEVILVDPAGVAMMLYDISHSGNQMLEDINHLLKYSGG